MSTPPSVVELPYSAPVPKGHAVLVVTFAVAEGEKGVTVVLDRTTSTLFCPEDIWGPMYRDPLLATTDPIALVTRWSWKVLRAFEGTSGGAVVSTRTYGDVALKTALVVEHAAAPYR